MFRNFLPPQPAFCSPHENAQPFDPFDPKHYAAAASIDGEVGVETVVTAIPVRRPRKAEWFRANGSPDFSLRAHIIEDDETGQPFLVMDHVALALPDLTSLRDLTLCVDRTGNYFFWPVPVVSDGGKPLGWHTTARQALASAIKKWTRVAANKKTQSYDIAVATGIRAEPVWPDKTRSELLRLAFGDTGVVADVTHPLVRRLNGLE